MASSSRCGGVSGCCLLILIPQRLHGEVSPEVGLANACAVAAAVSAAASRHAVL